MKNYLHFTATPIALTLFLSACTSPYEEVILEAQDGTRIAETKIFAGSSIPEKQRQDILQLAPQTVGDSFQITEINEVSATRADFNIQGPETDWEMLVEAVCGRIIVGEVREVGFAYAYVKFLDSGKVIKANRIFYTGEADCNALLLGEVEPEEAVTVEGLL